MNLFAFIQLLTTLKNKLIVYSQRPENSLFQTRVVNLFVKFSAFVAKNIPFLKLYNSINSHH